MYEYIWYKGWVDSEQCPGFQAYRCIVYTSVIPKTKDVLLAPYADDAVVIALNKNPAAASTMVQNISLKNGELK